jgi:hypothetical protein
MFKALKSFTGKITMIKNEVKDIVDKELIKDLTRAGYIVEIKDKEDEKPTTENKPTTKTKNK